MRNEMKMQELLQRKQGYTSLTLINRNQRPFVNIGREHFNSAQHDGADPVRPKSAGSHLNDTRFLAVSNAWERGSCQQGFSCLGESNLMPLGNSGGIPKRLHNIFFFKIGIIREKLLTADPLANLTNDHADGYPHTANTGLAAHNGGVLSYSVKIFIKHKINITQKSAKSKFTNLPMPRLLHGKHDGILVIENRKPKMTGGKGTQVTGKGRVSNEQ